MADSLKTLPLDKIVPADDNLRTTFTDIDELARSIEFVGLIEPIRVVKDGDTYKIVAGARRFEAITSLGWDEAKFIIESGKPDEAKRQASMIVENMQRVDLTPKEEAEGVRRLVQEHQMTQAEVASALGVTKQWVSDRWAMLNVPDHAFANVSGSTRPLSVEHLAMLGRLPDEVRERLTKDDSVPSQYDIEDRTAKVKKKAEAEREMKAMRKDGILVVTEPELKKIIKAEPDTLDGDDWVIKSKFLQVTEVRKSVWGSVDVPTIELKRVYGETTRDHKAVYVLCNNSGYPEWHKAELRVPVSMQNPDAVEEEEPDEYDLIDERNQQRNTEHKAACRQAEIDWVNDTKPAVQINTILVRIINSIHSGFQSFARCVEVLERLGLDVTDVDDSVSLEVQRENHAKNMETLYAYATKNSANLARAASTIEAIRNFGQYPGVEYPEAPEMEQYPDEEDDLL